MLVNRREIQVEWGHCDPAGIVFYPRYFEMFDASTAYLLQAASGMTKYDLLAHYGAAGFPMVDTGARFYIPSKFGDKIEIATTVTRFGRSSFDIDHKVMRGGNLLIEATEKRVWVSQGEDGTLKGQPIPETLAAQLRGEK